MITSSTRPMRILGGGLALALGGALCLLLPAAPSGAVTVGAPLAEISPSDAGPGASFGTSVAVSGTTAVVGAPDASVNGNTGQGKVYVYVKGSSGWVVQAELAAADGGAGDAFGWTVSISGSTVVVGAPQHGSQGAAYVFTKVNNKWTQSAELTPNGLNVQRFGLSVSISGTEIAVGQPYTAQGSSTQGVVLVYTKSTMGWVNTAYIVTRGTDDLFGYSVAVSGTTLAVGAPERIEGNGADPQQGAVDVYAKSGSSWLLQAQLAASDGTAGDQLGAAVTTTGSVIVAGAVGHGGTGGGYVFAKVNNKWTQQGELKPGDGQAGDEFGASVGLSGSIAVVGAPLHSVGNNAKQGSAYVFTKTTKGWNQTGELLASDGAPGDQFGTAVSDSSTTALVGSPGHPGSSATDPGAGYLFQS